MAEFHFLRPYWFMAAVPLLFILWRLWQRHYQSRSWRSVCDPRLLPYLLVGTTSQQQKWPLLLTLVTAMLVIIALAGPTWSKLEQPVFREQSALVIVLDLSRSMDATDIKPSRLARARHKVIDILNRRKEGQTALVVYAADAHTVSPLTEDSQTMIAMVKTLSTDLMPVQGSDVDKAVQHAIALLKQAGTVQGHILLISDGIARQQINGVATRVTQAGHRMSVLGVGTATGAPISLNDGGFLKDTNGAIVIPKLEEAALQQLASASGGRYHSLSADERDLDMLLAIMSPQRLNAQRKETSFMADRWREEGPWLLLLVLPLAALGFRRGYLLALLVLLLPAMPKPVYAFEWQNLWQRPDQQAARQLQANQSTETIPPAEIFKDPEWRAAADYRAGHYQKAIESLQGIDTADALYNKGNALARLGNYPEAIKAYDEALKKQADHADAKYNREQVEKLQQQQQQQSSDQNKQDGQQQDKDQQEDGDKQQGEDQKQGKDQQQKNTDQQDQQKSDNKSGQQQQDSAQEKDAQQQQNKDSEDKAKQQAQESKQAEAEQPQDTAQQSQLSPAEQREEKEKQQATEQWLRRIPDDPGGLLRRKFQYETQRQQAEGNNRQDDHRQEAW